MAPVLRSTKLAGCTRPRMEPSNGCNITRPMRSIHQAPIKQATSPAKARQIPAMMVTFASHRSLAFGGADGGGGGGIHSIRESMLSLPDGPVLRIPAMCAGI